MVPPKPLAGGRSASEPSAAESPPASARVAHTSASALKAEGVALLNRGAAREALDRLERARASLVDDAELLSALALAYKANRRLEAALCTFGESLRLAPTHAATWLHYGRALRQARRPREALLAMQKSLSLEPRSAHGWSVLSNAQREQGLGEQAVASARRALSIDPYLAEAHLNHGAAHHCGGNHDAAATSYYAAHLSSPRSGAALKNLRLLFRGAGSPGFGRDLESEAGVLLVRRLVAGEPEPKLLWELAQRELQTGRKPCALVILGELTKLEPTAPLHRRIAALLFEEGHEVLASRHLLSAMTLGGDVRSFRAMGRWLTSASARQLEGDWEPAFRNCPDDPDALGALAIAAARGHAHELAEELMRRALRLEPNSVSLRVSLSSLLNAQGRIASAVEICREALRIDPRAHAAHSNLLLSMHRDPRFAPEEIFEAHRAYGAQLDAELFGAAGLEPALGRRAAPPRVTPGASRRLRVGYLSPDFREHPVARFIEPVFRHHDRAAFEVIGYSDALHPDETTRALAALAERFESCVGLGDEQLHQRLVADRVDVLVDLAGHTGRNRLPVFARRAAPVQVSWIGYFDTTGVSAMDYRLTDEHACPEGAQRHFVERLVRLPRSATCFDLGELPPPSVAPHEPRGFVTFGCYNNPAKLSSAALDAFAEILLRRPGTRLRLQYKAWRSPAMRRRFCRALEERGIEPARVELEPDCALGNFPESFRHIDIALDPFPQSGETTAIYTLAMGVPLVSLEGETMAQRLGSRVLRVAGLHDWVAKSPEQYVQIACDLADRGAERVAWRDQLRVVLQRSALCDAARLTRDLEGAYRAMCDEVARRG